MRKREMKKNLVLGLLLLIVFLVIIIACDNNNDILKSGSSNPQTLVDNLQKANRGDILSLNNGCYTIKLWAHNIERLDGANPNNREWKATFELSVIDPNGNEIRNNTYYKVYSKTDLDQNWQYLSDSNTIHCAGSIKAGLFPGDGEWLEVTTFTQFYRVDVNINGEFITVFGPCNFGQNWLGPWDCNDFVYEPFSPEQSEELGTTTYPTSAPTTPYIYMSYSNCHPRVYWNSVSGATEYKIYRATNISGPYSYLDKTSSLEYIDDELTIYSCNPPNGKTNYFYKVKASNCAGESNSYSNERLVVCEPPVL